MVGRCPIWDHGASIDHEVPGEPVLIASRYVLYTADWLE